MDPYILYNPTDGYVEHSLVPFITHFLSQEAATSPSFAPAHSMKPALYDRHPAPAYPYPRAPNAFSAAVQLYSRSSHLATADTLARRFRDRVATCSYGCAGTLEDAHHIFVACPAFASLRSQFTSDILTETRSLLRAAEVEDAACESLCQAAASLFRDEPFIWPEY